MSSVENELWNIFTYYTLHGDCLDPEHMRATQFVKLARDVQIVGTTDVSEADVHVAYTAEVKRPHRVGVRRMTYNDFLTALLKISAKVFPGEADVDDAFQRLLIDHILPLASRRCPDSVDVFLEDPDVVAVYEYYRDALQQIFQFYATSTTIKNRKLEGANSKAVAPLKAKRLNTMKASLGYPEFLKFASDFDLSSSVILSTLEIGDIYLSSVKAQGGHDTVRKLTFSEFWEALVRCALVAYSKISDATIIDKIRGLFLYMWRTVNRSVARVMTGGRRNVSTYAGDLLSGAMLFNKRFTAQWAADGYRDYLTPDASQADSGKTVLNRLLTRQGAGAVQTAARTDEAKTEHHDSAAAAAGAGAGVGAGGGAANGSGAGEQSPSGRDERRHRSGSSRHRHRGGHKKKGKESRHRSHRSRRHHHRDRRSGSDASYSSGSEHSGRR